MANDLKKIATKVISETLLNSNLSNVVLELTQLTDDLLNHCETSEDREILKCLFREVEIGDNRYFVPKKDTKLSIHQILRLMALGFKFGKIDPRFEIKVVKSKKIPCFDDHPLPETEWDNQYACILKHHAVKPLFENSKKVESFIHSHFESQESLPTPQAMKVLNRALRHQLADVMFHFSIPSNSDLENPKLIQTRPKYLPEGQGHILEYTPSEISQKVTSLQSSGHLPSLINSSGLHEIQQESFHIFILLDISASMSKLDIFKLAHLSCNSMVTTFREKLPNAEVSIIPYSDAAHNPVENINHFIMPGGGTATDAAFDLSQVLLQKKIGHKAVLNITDGLPNDLELARQYASRFPEQKIEYAQIIFGDTVRSHDLADYMIQQEMIKLGIEPQMTRYEKYVSEFSSVTTAAKGEQLVLWVVNELANGMLTMLDLAIGTSLFKFCDRYKFS